MFHTGFSTSTCEPLMKAKVVQRTHPTTKQNLYVFNPITEFAVGFLFVGLDQVSVLAERESGSLRSVHCISYSHITVADHITITIIFRISVGFLFMYRIALQITLTIEYKFTFEITVADNCVVSANHCRRKAAYANRVAITMCINMCIYIL